MKKQHPNGISLTLSQGWLADETSNGFRVSTHDSTQRRIPEEVAVSLLQGQPQPHGKWPNTRSIDQRLLHYRVDTAQGGSGGSTYIFTAWESTGSGHVIIQQHTQAEAPAKPNFELAWSVIENMQVPGNIVQ